MVGIYAAMVYLGRWLAQKHPEKKYIATLYPFICGIFLLLPLAINGTIQELLFGLLPTVRASQLTQMIVNFLVGIALMIAYYKRMTPINLKKDKIIFVVPVVLHIYDLIVGFGLGITKSYIPVAVCAVIHFAYLYLMYRKAKSAAPPKKISKVLA